MPNKKGYVQAIGLPVEGFRRFKRLKAGKRQGRVPKQEKAMCRQRAGCNAGTLTARNLLEAAARCLNNRGL